MKHIVVNGEIRLIYGKADEFDEDSIPTLMLYNKVRSMEIPIKELHIDLEELFWFFVSSGYTKCPICNSEISYEYCAGDSSVGMSSYEMFYCTNDKCKFYEMDSEDKQKEFIDLFLSLLYEEKPIEVKVSNMSESKTKQFLRRKSRRRWIAGRLKAGKQKPSSEEVHIFHAAFNMGYNACKTKQVKKISDSGDK